MVSNEFRKLVHYQRPTILSPFFESFLMRLFSCSWILLLAIPAGLLAEDGWVHFPGGDGPGKGKHVVLMAGDEEYRSEETMPMLAQILSVHHGFDCTVLFSMSVDGTFIDPNNGASLEGTEKLADADLMITANRFRHPDEATMKNIHDFVEAGKPIIGLRTSTHAFNGIQGKYAFYNYNHGGPKWEQGFGREILGETWVRHHGGHKTQATGGKIVEEKKDHPVLRGVVEESIFAPSDVYEVRLPLPGDSQPLVLGAVLDGMNVGDPPIAGPKNKPMMPVVWTKSYTTDSGKAGKVVTTTMGASLDFVEPGLRRIVVNSVYWLLDLEVPSEAKVDFITEFKPSMFEFHPENREPDYWKKRNLKPSDFALEKQPN